MLQVCIRKVTTGGTPGRIAPLCSRFIVLQPSDTCASVVARYNISYSRLYAFNPGLDCNSFEQTALLMGTPVRHRPTRG